MRSPIPWFLGGVLALAFVVPAAQAQSACPRLTSGPAAMVRAGEVVEIAWADAPKDTRELELLLSLDGGRTYRMRITPELDGRETHWRWRVPALASEHARLRLRFGREHAEQWAEPGAEFAIRGGETSHATALAAPPWRPGVDVVSGYWDESANWGMPTSGGSPRADLEAPHFEVLVPAAPCTSPNRDALLFSPRAAATRETISDCFIRGEPAAVPTASTRSLPIRE